MASDQNSSDPTPECQTMALNHDSLSPAIQRQGKVTQADRTVTTSNELDLLFSPMFDELLNGSSKKHMLKMVKMQMTSLSTYSLPQYKTKGRRRHVMLIRQICTIKEKVEKGIVKLFFVGTEYQLDDLLTKSLPVERFQYLVRRLGMRCLTPVELEALANEPA
nr:ribonuclease H [Tanacetum cinerariifolium]